MNHPVCLKCLQRLADAKRDGVAREQPAHKPIFTFSIMYFTFTLLPFQPLSSDMHRRLVSGPPTLSKV
jgi:hypothetical protein